MDLKLSLSDKFNACHNAKVSHEDMENFVGSLNVINFWSFKINTPAPLFFELEIEPSQNNIRDS